MKYRVNRKFPPGPGETQKEVDERAMNQKKWFQNASIVAVCNPAGDACSGWLAVENISLAAVADGLGSCIMALLGDEKKEAERLLGLPEGCELTCLLKVRRRRRPCESSQEKGKNTVGSTKTNTDPPQNTGSHLIGGKRIFSPLTPFFSCSPFADPDSTSSYSGSKSKMKSRRQGRGDAGVYTHMTRSR